MNKPTKKQQNDPNWWGENDPSGGEATHYDMEDAGRYQAWIQKGPNFWMWWTARGWEEAEEYPSNGPAPHSWDIIPRPTHFQWTGPEDGLPPVGIECEYRRNTDDWRVEVVFGHRVDSQGNVSAFINFDGGKNWDYSNDPNKFRPLRTAEEVQREAMIAAAMEYRPVGLSVHEHQILFRLCGRLYDAGLLHKPMNREKASEKIYHAIASHDEVDCNACEGQGIVLGIVTGGPDGPIENFEECELCNGEGSIPVDVDAILDALNYKD